MRTLNRKFGLMKKVLFVFVLIIFCSMMLQPALAQGDVEVGVFEPITTSPGSRIEVPIEIRGVQDLYAFDLEMQFDPAVFDAEDADPNMQGIQTALGTFLDAGLLLFNDVNPETGLVRFAMSQVNPSEGKSGDGILLVLYLSAKTTGESTLTVNSITLSDRKGVEIPTSGVGAVITVSEDAPAVTSTSIPVQDPTNIIIIPTLAPTPTNTLAPTETPMPTATAMPEPTSTQKPAGGETKPTEMTSQPEAIGEGEEKSGSALRENWWIIPLAAVGAAGVGAYLRRLKKKSDEDKPSEPPTN